MTDDPFELERFVQAQSPVFDVALEELRAGRKRTHWMWFMFPQLRGLGHSATAQFYAIGSLDEAHAYLAHSILGPRLLFSTKLVLESTAGSLHELFGSPDDMKFHSCMTLFDAAAGQAAPIFNQALERWFAAVPDPQTLRLLAASGA